MRLLVPLFLCVAQVASAQNLLAGRAPSRAEGVTVPQYLTDGFAPHDGEPWDVPSASRLAPGAVIEWDLGAPAELRAVALQADNNDEYILSTSVDGETWSEAWRSGTAGAPGLQLRSTKELRVTARYVRLTAQGGDGAYSVSELEVFGPSIAGSALLRARWVPRHPLEQTFTAWLLLSVGLLLLASSRLPRELTWLIAAGGLAGTAWLVFSATAQTPHAPAQLPWIRACVALLAAAAVLRERLFTARWPAAPRLVLGTLALTGVMGLWCFLNLGRPQFHDVGQRRATWLHHYDMRTYFPIAKYFDELRFDGVYAASALAVAEERGLDAMGPVALRDLRTHHMTTVGESREHLERVRARFSPERWAAFVSDMRAFRSAMGDPGFLGSMHDHGGNATPVWFLAARALFKDTPAGDAALWRGVWADVLLALLAFGALGWAFGARTAFLAMTVFGAMDFYQFGSNWFGASLRHDWLSLWAIGVALLQRRHFALAGAAFAWSAWIRAFPALTLVTLSLPTVYAAGRLLVRGRVAHAWQQAWQLRRVALGVLVASVVLVGLSTWVFGVDAWLEWLRKVQTLDKDNHVNNLSFRTYVSTSREAWWLACAGSLAALFVALRGAPMARAAAWGVALVPIVFNPANYYLHAVFLLVTLAGEARAPKGPRVDGRGTLTWLVLTLMCAASYFTTLSTSTALHFQQDTVVLFVALGALLALEFSRRRVPSHA
jgi:hypothetical protein